jgi:Fe-S-cluster containining protein
LADEIGLTIMQREGDDTPTFRLPCPCFRQGRCSTYDKRPQACGRYRCSLLQGFEAQAIDLDMALGPIVQAKELIAEIEALLGDTNEAQTIWQRAVHFAEVRGLRLHSSEFTRAFPQIQIKISALYMLCHRHFEPAG